MASTPIPSGEALVILATVFALQLAQGRTPEQLALISAFFNVLGDNLALIAARRSLPGPGETGTASE